MTPNYAVVATHNRHGMLQDLVAQVLAQGTEMIVVIDNASRPALVSDDASIRVIRDEEQPPNLSRLWNLGLDNVWEDAVDKGYDEWNVAVLNDDAELPLRWFEQIGYGLRVTGAALASGDAHGVGKILHTKQKTIPCEQRIAGWANLHRGELGLRYDEAFRFWYGDDDLCWRARGHGGSLVVPYFAGSNRDENGHLIRSEELQRQAAADRETFLAKWGASPC